MPSATTLLATTFVALSIFGPLSLAHGPHYLPNYAELERSLAARAAAEAQQRAHQAFLPRHKSKKSMRKRRGTCTASGSGSASTALSSGSTMTKSQHTHTASAPAASSSADSSASDNSTSSTAPASLSALGITQFLGTNGPGIGSWFRTDSSQDSTNGRSWCSFPYDDSSNGFAPDVTLMLSNFNNDYNAAAEAYCGLEATVTTPSGTSKTMYIIDGFDHKWVRTPGSIDITKNTFAELYGSATDDKNVVIQGLTWKLTGNRSQQYKFQGAGN